MKTWGLPTVVNMGLTTNVFHIKIHTKLLQYFPFTVLARNLGSSNLKYLESTRQKETGADYCSQISFIFFSYRLSNRSKKQQETRSVT